MKAAFHCSLCSKPAATVQILPRGTPNALKSNDQDTLCITGFIGEDRELFPASTGPVLRACLERTDAAALYRIERLWAPFYCPDCEAIYCRDHWTILQQFDGDFFDCSHGHCPKGHRRLIED